MKRRKRPEHSWDRLNGTRLEVFDGPGGEVRRVAVNIHDALPAVVSFGVHAMTKDAGGHTLRFLAVDNFNDDNRELFQIPEAAAWCRRLWFHGAPLLRLLTESSGDTPADDRLGLSQREVSQLGLGWWEVYVIGFCNPAARLQPSGGDDGGPVWELSGTMDRPRDELRAELLQMSDTNPDGYTFDGAANRRWFAERNMDAARQAVAAMVADSRPDSVVLVLSLLDAEGWRVANATVDAAALQNQLKRCRADDTHPAAIVAVDRSVAATVLDMFAPEASKHVANGRPDNGGMWVAFVAHDGTQLAAIHPPGTEATT